MKVGRPRLTTRRLSPFQTDVWIKLSRIGGWVSAERLSASIRSCDGLVIRGLAYKKTAGVIYQGCEPERIIRYTYYKARGKAVA